MKPIMWSFGMQSRALFHVGENPDIENKAAKSYHTCVYLPGKVKYSRTLVRGDLWDITLDGAQPLLYGYPQQYAKGLGYTPCPYYNAATDEEMDLPLLTVNRYGKGKVYFLNCGLLEDYINSYLPAQRKWGKKLLQKIAPAPQAYLEHKNGSVELVSYEDKAKGKKIFTLVNHGGREGSLRTLFVGEQIADPQPAYRLDLMIRSDVDLIVKDGNTELQTIRKGKYIAVPLVMDSTWKFIKVKTK